MWDIARVQRSFEEMPRLPCYESYMEGLYGNKRSAQLPSPQELNQTAKRNKIDKTWKSILMDAEKDEEVEVDAMESEGQQCEGNSAGNAWYDNPVVRPHFSKQCRIYERRQRNAIRSGTALKHVNICKTMTSALDSGEATTSAELMDIFPGYQMDAGFDMVQMFDSYPTSGNWQPYHSANTCVLNYVLKELGDVKKELSDVKKELENLKNEDKKRITKITKLADQAMARSDSVFENFNVRSLKCAPIIVTTMHTERTVDIIKAARGYSKPGAKHPALSVAYMTFLLDKIIAPGKHHLYSSSSTCDGYLPLPERSLNALKVAFYGAFGFPCNEDGTLIDEIDEEDMLGQFAQVEALLKNKIFTHFQNAHGKFNRKHKDLGFPPFFTPAQAEAIRERKRLGWAVPVDVPQDFE